MGRGNTFKSLSLYEKECTCEKAELLGSASLAPWCLEAGGISVAQDLRASAALTKQTRTHLVK